MYSNYTKNKANYQGVRERKAFKKSTIVSIIEENISAWLESITDKSLRQEVADNFIVTGGAIASMLQGYMPNDFDIYIQNSNVAFKLTKYYVASLGGKYLTAKQIPLVRLANGATSIEVVDKNGDFFTFSCKDNSKINDYFPTALTSNAVTLKGDIQIITRFTGSPEEIHKNFDFSHTTNYYTRKDKLVLNNLALESIMSKQLKYVGSLFPICTMFRLRKFLKRGWDISAGEMLKIAFDIHKLNIDDVDVLKDQLIGVDALHFLELLEKIKQDRDALSRTNLFALIDSVFV